MSYLKFNLSITVFLFVSSLFSQTDAKHGNFDFLKGQSQLRVVFNYKGMNVGTKSESEYVDDKIYKYNQEESGKGDEWFEAWRNARKENYEPNFIESLKRELSKRKLEISSGARTQFILTVTTTKTEPGFYALKVEGVSYCSFHIAFTNKSTQEEYNFVMNRISGELSVIKHFDVTKRISLCYAKAGRLLGKYISKSIG